MRVGTKRELGERCDLVGLCVVTADDVDSVLLGDDGVLAGMAPGSIVTVHSTVSPDDCRRWAAIAADRGPPGRCSRQWRPDGRGGA